MNRLEQSQKKGATLRFIPMIGKPLSALAGKRQSISPFWMVPFLLAACVTVNVYFPAPAVDAVAEQMVREIWNEMGQDSKVPIPKPSPDKPPRQEGSVKRSAPHHNLTPSRLLTTWLDWMVEPAHAGANLDVSTAAIHRLKERLRARAAEELKPFLYEGVIGINRRGDIEIRREGDLALKNRAKLRRLVQADNQDRAALYSEIAVANRHPEWTDDIRNRFALKWVSQAKKGWWVQNANGKWRKK